MIFDKSSLSSSDEDPTSLQMHACYLLHSDLEQEMIHFVDIAHMCHLHDLNALEGASIVEVVNNNNARRSGMFINDL